MAIKYIRCDHKNNEVIEVEEFKINQPISDFIKQSTIIWRDCPGSKPIFMTPAGQIDVEDGFFIVKRPSGEYFIHSKEYLSAHYRAL